MTSSKASASSMPHLIDMNQSLHFGPERSLLFHSPHPHELGISIEHSPIDGYVRITSFVSPDDERSPGGSSMGIIEGKLKKGDVVCEAAGVNLRRPVSEHMWKLTVGLMRVAPRPIEVIVAEEVDENQVQERSFGVDSDEEREEIEVATGSYYQLEVVGNPHGGTRTPRAAVHHLPGSPGALSPLSQSSAADDDNANPAFADMKRFGPERAITFHTTSLGIKLHRSPLEGLVHILSVTPYKPWVAGARNDDYNPTPREGPNDGALEAGDAIFEVGGVDLRHKVIGVAEWADMVHFIKHVGRPLEIVVAKDSLYASSNNAGEGVPDASTDQQVQEVGVGGKEVIQTELEDSDKENNVVEQGCPNNDEANEAVNETTLEEEGQEVAVDSTLDNICFNVTADDVCNNFSFVADDICTLPCGGNGDKVDASDDDDIDALVQSSPTMANKLFLTQLSLEEETDEDDYDDDDNNMDNHTESLNNAVIEKEEEEEEEDVLASPQNNNDIEPVMTSPCSPDSSPKEKTGSWMKKYEPLLLLTPISPNEDAASTAGSMAGAALSETKDRPWMNRATATPAKNESDDEDEDEDDCAESVEDDSWIKQTPMTPVSPIDEDAMSVMSVTSVTKKDDSWIKATSNDALAKEQQEDVGAAAADDLWIALGSETKPEKSPMPFHTTMNPTSPDASSPMKSPKPTHSIAPASPAQRYMASLSTSNTSPVRSPATRAQPRSPLSPAGISPESHESISPPTSPVPVDLSVLSAMTEILSSPVDKSLLSPTSPKPALLSDNQRGFSTSATVGTGVKEVTKSVAQLRKMFTPVKSPLSVAMSPPTSPKASAMESWEAALDSSIVFLKEEECGIATPIASPCAEKEEPAAANDDPPAHEFDGLYSPIVTNPTPVLPMSPTEDTVPTSNAASAQLPPSSPLREESPGGWSATSPFSDSSVESYHDHSVASPMEASVAYDSVGSPFSEADTVDHSSGPSPMEASAQGSIWSQERPSIPSPVEDENEDTNEENVVLPNSPPMIPLSPSRGKRNELVKNILKEKRGSPVRDTRSPTDPVAFYDKEEELPASPIVESASNQIQVPQLEPTPSKTSPKLEPTPGPAFLVRQLEPTPADKKPLNQSADIESPFHNMFLNNLRNGFDTLDGVKKTHPAVSPSESRDDTDQQHASAVTEKLHGDIRIVAKPEKRNHLLSSWAPSSSSSPTSPARSTISVKEEKKAPMLPPPSTKKKSNVSSSTATAATKLFSDRSFQGDKSADSPFVGNVKFATPTRKVPQSSLFSQAFVVQNHGSTEDNANGDNNNKTRWFQTDSPLFTVPDHTNEGTVDDGESAHIQFHSPQRIQTPSPLAEGVDAKGVNTSAFDMTELSDGPEGDNESLDSPSFELNDTIVYAGSTDALDCCGVTSPLSCGENMFEGLMSDCGAGDNFEMFREKKEKVNRVQSPRRKNLLSRLRSKNKKNKGDKKKKKEEADYYGTLDNQGSNEEIKTENTKTSKGAPRNKKHAVQLTYRNMRGKSIASASQFARLMDDEVCV